MFGYLFPTKEVLTLAERKIFRDYFCTLCLAHRYRYGRLASLLNNFDVAVFAMILNLYGNHIENCGRCAKYVSNRREKFTEQRWADLVDYNINLMRKKMDDDLRDNPGLKASASHLVFNGIFGRNRRKNTVLYDIFDYEFESFMAIESRRPRIDEILDAYELFARNTFGALPGVQSTHVDLFAAMNRWIYWIDAIHDYDEDIKDSSYNPIVCYSGVGNKTRFLENNMLQLIDSFEVQKHAIATAYSKCCYPLESRIILENIIEHTIPNTTSIILQNGSISKRRRLL